VAVSVPAKAVPPPARHAETGAGAADAGSIAPMILLFFCVAALVVTGTITASAAFLAQRDLVAVCDAASLAGADALAESVAYGTGLGESVPLQPAEVQQAVGQFYARNYSGDPYGLTLSAATDGTTVTVTCSRTVPLPFGAVFGHGDGLRRVATASARSPLQ